VKKGDLLAQLDSSVSDYDLKLAESNLEKANLVYQQTLKNTPTSQPGFKETIELKKIDVDQAQLALNDLKRKFETASLISPVDGKVQHVYINLGDTVVPFKPVVVLADPDHIEVRAEVSAADFAKLTEKMPVMISLANDTTVVYSGYIRQLTSVANNSKQTSAPMIYFARIAFNDNPPEIVKIGAFGSVQINVEKKLGVLWLPPNALQGVSPSQYVNLKDGNKTVKVYIRTGLSTKERVEITQGLSDGQVIILP
jgi:HlyD family secretion protein